MNTFVSDTQVIGETDDTAFSFVHQGPVSAAVTLKNAGTNTINYHWQEFNGTTWAEFVVTVSTLTAGQVATATVSSNYAQVRLRANASGSSLLDFSITRAFNRLSGGSVPLLAI